MSKIILAVDDSMLVRNAVSSALTEAGYTVITANDGLEGIKQLQQNDRVDLIISDINMPNMDGITMVEKIKEMPAYCNIPVCMLTMASSEENVASARGAGVKAWFAKPFTGAELLEVVDSIC